MLYEPVVAVWLVVVLEPDASVAAYVVAAAKEFDVSEPASAGEIAAVVQAFDHLGAYLVAGIGPVQSGVSSAAVGMAALMESDWETVYLPGIVEQVWAVAGLVAGNLRTRQDIADSLPVDKPVVAEVAEIENGYQKQDVVLASGCNHLEMRDETVVNISC